MNSRQWLRAAQEQLVDAERALTANRKSLYNESIVLARKFLRLSAKAQAQEEAKT